MLASLPVFEAVKAERGVAHPKLTAKNRENMLASPKGSRMDSPDALKQVPVIPVPP